MGGAGYGISFRDSFSLFAFLTTPIRHATSSSHVNQVSIQRTTSPSPVSDVGLQMEETHLASSTGVPTSSQEAPNLSDRAFETGGQSSNRHARKKVGPRLARGLVE